MDSKKQRAPEISLVEASLLLDIYGEMLTEHQRRFMRLHFDEDLSFSQIAREFNVSRQAVHDSVKHALKSLGDFERALKLVEKGQTSTERQEGLVGGRQLVERLSDLRNRAVAELPDSNAQWLIDEMDALIVLLRPERSAEDSDV